MYGDQAAVVLGCQDIEQVDAAIDDPATACGSEIGADVREPQPQKGLAPPAKADEANNDNEEDVGETKDRAVAGSGRSSHTARNDRTSSDADDDDDDSADGMEVNGNEHDAEFRPEVRHRIFDRWVEHLLQYVDVDTSNTIGADPSVAGQAPDEPHEARQEKPVGQGGQSIAPAGAKADGFKAKRFWSVQNSHFQNQFLVACRGMMLSRAENEQTRRMPFEHGAAAVQASAAV